MRERKILSASALIAIIVGLYFAAFQCGPAHAEEIPEETIAASEEAGVDPIDLAGAVNTTMLAPRVYLCLVGELRCPVEVPPHNQRVECIIEKESGGQDIPNKQGSGANGPGQYFPGTWFRHLALYRAYTGDWTPRSLHSLTDVRIVMNFMLVHYPGSRTEWSVGGC